MWNTLKPRLLHHAVDRIEAEQRLGPRVAVAAAVRVLEEVELEGPHAEASRR
jgi:hypothetical protein